MKTFHSKPHFQTIIDQQRLAYYRLTKEGSTRSVIERNNFERQTNPVPAEDVELPRAPMVRLKENHDDYSFGRWIVLAEISQTPGKLILINVVDGTIETRFTADQLELVPPTELT
jgi:hypothetical protein